MSPHPVETVSDERLRDILTEFERIISFGAEGIVSHKQISRDELICILTLAIEALSRRSLDTADGVDDETRAFVDAVQLIEDAGWVVLRPEQVAYRPSRPSRNAEVAWPGVKFCEIAERNAWELAKFIKGEDDKQVVTDAALAIKTLLASHSTLAITEPERGGEPAGRDARAEILMGIATTLRRTAEMTNATFQNFYAAQADACEAGAVAITLASPPAQEAVTDAMVERAIDAWFGMGVVAPVTHPTHKIAMHAALTAALHPSSKRG